MSRFARIVRVVIARPFWVVMGLLILVAAGHLLWAVWPTETGFSTIANVWRDATWGTVAGNYVPVPRRTSVEQAEVLLGEADRVLREHPDDATIAMGAALALCEPTGGFRSNQVNAIHRSPAVGVWVEWDEHAIKLETEQFHAACSARQEELASLATKYEPENEAWWQLRAILLWSHLAIEKEHTWPVSDWSKLLVECRKHDQDNSLYSALSAYIQLEKSAEVDYPENVDLRLVVEDVEQFNRGVELLSEMHLSSKFEFGVQGCDAIVKFLSLTQIPNVEHAEFVYQRAASSSSLTLVYRVWQWQRQRSIDLEIKGGIEAAIEVELANLKFLDQVIRSNIRNSANSIVDFAIIASSNHVRELVDLGGGSHIEIDDIDQIAREAELRKLLAIEIGPNLSSWARPPRSQFDWKFINWLLAYRLSRLAVILWTIVLVLKVCCRAGNLSHQEIPIWANVGSLILAQLSTAILFGLAPAELISVETQSFVAWSAYALIVVGVPVTVGFVWLKKKKFRFGLGKFLIGTTIVAVLTVTVFHHLSQPFGVSIPTLRWELPNVESLQAIVPNVTWMASIQWLAYQGEYLTLAMWTGLLACFVAFNSRVECQKTKTEGMPWLRPFAMAISRSCLSGCALVLLASLVLQSIYVGQVEKNFQQSMRYARNPQGYWAEVERQYEAVRANKEIMKRLEAAVDLKMEQRSLQES